MAEGQHGQDNGCRAAEEQQDPPACRHRQSEREDHLRDPAHEQIPPKRTAATVIDFPGQTKIRKPKTAVSTPDSSVAFQK